MTIMMDMRMVGGGENFPEALVNRVWSLTTECTQSSISNKIHVKMEGTIQTPWSQFQNFSPDIALYFYNLEAFDVEKEDSYPPPPG